MTACLIYITAPNAEEAEAIGFDLVQRRLAACANILGESTAIYHWNGKIEKGKEIILIVKSTNILLNQLTQRVVELHSYECPCVITVPIVDGFVPFLEWITKETEE